MRAGRWLPIVASVGWLGFATTSAVRAPEKVSFGRDILPILSDKCFKCHGPDPASRMAGLRLDTSAGAFADRGGRWPIVPGKPQDSLILKRIHDKSSPMPPVDSGKTLTPAEKELIRRWILEGARYGKLWSFEPIPTSVPVPKVAGAWAKDDIDRFVYARMTRAGLKPSLPASKSRWLRRVTLDLTGLPPTESEIADFVSNGNYERVVDRLLASPRFGERMAVEWLDAARYSDSYGYQSDLLMPSWPYRDWVVRAFNRNLPYDQFLTQQIAGDLLPNATDDQVLATAFNRLHRQSNEGGSIALEYKTEYAVDRVSTFGTAVLGLTLGCARCHDHKFDPVTQKEFYQLFGYFNSIDEFGLLLSTEIVPTPSLLLPTPEQSKQLTTLRARDRAAKLELDKALANPVLEETPSVIDLKARFSLDSIADGKFADGLGGGAFGAPLGKVDLTDGRIAKAVKFDGENGVVFKGLPAKERWEPFSWSFWISDPRQKAPVVLLHRTGGTDVGFCGFDLMLEDGYLTARVMRQWPGNAVAIRTKTRISKDQWTQIGWTWDGSGRASGLNLYVNGQLAPTTLVVDQLWKKINAYGDLGPSGGDWCFGQRFRDAGFKGGKLDEVAFSDRELSSPEVKRLFDGREIGVSYVRTKVAAAHKAVRETQEALANFEEGIREISVMREAKPTIPSYLLARGNYDAPRNAKTLVQRGVPAVLPKLQPGRNDRLALAKWATSKVQPLTARVAVNRLWQTVFGTGIVETSENFGVQGSPPSDPALLDFLARRFMDEGWDTKKAIRHMVLSATYRQDSARPKNAKDPENRFYARGPSRRLSAEMVRDTALAASGLLNPKAGGPPVNAYQPAGIWQENNTMSPAFVQSTGTELYRRSLYSTWKRTTPVPSMMMFDATSREACSVRRPSTNTPLQALVLLNDVQFVEAARVLAERVMKSETDDSARIQEAFVRLAGRRADARELAVLLDTLREQRMEFRKDKTLAAKLIRFGDSKPDPALDPVELAANTVAVQLILNSDAVIWKR